MSKTIGSYIVTRKIGAGGMATVYLAKHKLLDTQVALKVLLPNLTANPSVRQRFVNEAKMMAGLDHPNIVRLHDFIERGENLVLVMEYVEGTPLDLMIGEKYGPIPYEKALPMFQQILSGMEYAHSKGIIHRDLKPSNVLVSSDGVVKVADFGIAKVIGQNNLTKTGVKLGTLCYMSPEQVLGKEVDKRTDVYALGATLYEMLAGNMPRGEGNTSEYQVMKEIIEGDLPDPRTFYPHIPEWLVSIISKAMARDLKDRIGSCSEFADLLEKGADNPQSGDGWFSGSDSEQQTGSKEISSVNTLSSVTNTTTTTERNHSSYEQVNQSVGSQPVDDIYDRARTSKKSGKGLLWGIVAVVAVIIAFAAFSGKNGFGGSGTATSELRDGLALFEKQFGTNGMDFAWSVKTIDDGGYILAGYTDPTGSDNCNVMVMKISEEGEQLWDRVYSSAADQSCFSVIEVSGGYLLSCFTSAQGASYGDIMVKKIDENGSLIWSNTYGTALNEWGFISAVQNGNGSVSIVCGHTSDMEDESNVIVFNISGSSGRENWYQIVNSQGIQVPYSVCAGPSNSILVLGRTRGAGDENGDAFLMKLDSSGQASWLRNYGGSADEWGRGVQRASDGGYILAVYSSSYGSGGDIWLVKVNSSGTIEWNKNYGGAGKDWPYGVLADSEGYTIAGRTDSFSSGDHDAWLIRTDLRGNTIWERKFGGRDDDKAYALDFTANGGYVLAGMSNSNNSGNEQFYIVVTDENGEVN